MTIAGTKVTIDHTSWPPESCHGTTAQAIRTISTAPEPIDRRAIPQVRPDAAAIASRSIGPIARSASSDIRSAVVGSSTGSVGSSASSFDLASARSTSRRWR